MRTRNLSGAHTDDLVSIPLQGTCSGRMPAWCAVRRQGSGTLSSSTGPAPRLASGAQSLDEGSDNGKHPDLDSPFDLSLARCGRSSWTFPANSLS